ncbi:GNAT family N-acetyltransferase [Methylococcus sp. EFPC2]|uniref:GNAT family N-acetyltransferase n=1 Tax=Methylococcus sp. EFPC2 TaxID=2812648 RepID=UPI001967FCA2|nr:GNAT family N-acetyltransferase [Methylococcus sp. EFPC2]QSA98421.1 GNAT family N-acetyltransferase [Methylococcus sp. EFPC2]
MLADAGDVQRLVGDVRIASTTTNIPHPYPDGAAEAWIESHAPGYRARQRVAFAVVLADISELIGTVSLIDISLEHSRAELAYWIAVDHWGNGYCTEGVGRLIRFAHEHLSISRFVARCLARNPASARVLEKAGLSREGFLPKHAVKNGQFEDLLLYGLNLPDRVQR